MHMHMHMHRCMRFARAMAEPGRSSAPSELPCLPLPALQSAGIDVTAHKHTLLIYFRGSW